MKYETLSRSEENEHGIVSAKEMISILKYIAENAIRIALDCTDGSCSVMTTLLGVNDKGLWLEQSTNQLDNKRILESEDLIFVSTHLNVKVQFAARQTRSMEYQGYSAFYLPLPKCIYRLQRRNSFRINVQPAKPLRCAIPTNIRKSSQPCEVNLMDISAGGMKLTCVETDIELVQGQTYENCQIKLPDLGTISATVIVRSLFSLPTKSGHTIKRAGCQFINLSGASNILLQRYVNNMQQH
ncbi:MAG: flagellar brake protein [Gallionella sp.]|nr:flagellar brake protein [Gallionella sp.]